MMGVAATITVQMITHVNEFFCHHDLDRTGLGQIDTFEVDQDPMSPITW
jgi:hypothetical protein